MPNILRFGLGLTPVNRLTGTGVGFALFLVLISEPSPLGSTLPVMQRNGQTVTFCWSFQAEIAALIMNVREIFIMLCTIVAKKFCLDYPLYSNHRSEPGYSVSE
jgi:hypothetical protein